MQYKLRVGDYIKPLFSSGGQNFMTALNEILTILLIFIISVGTVAGVLFVLYALPALLED